MHGGVEIEIIFIRIQANVFCKTVGIFRSGFQFVYIEQSYKNGPFLSGQCLVDQGACKTEDQDRYNDIPFIIIQKVGKFLFESSVLQ